MKKSVSISLTLSVDRAWNRCLCHHSSEPLLVFWQLLAAKKKIHCQESWVWYMFLQRKKISSGLSTQPRQGSGPAMTVFLSVLAFVLISWFSGQTADPSRRPNMQWVKRENSGKNCKQKLPASSKQYSLHGTHALKYSVLYTEFAK